MLEDIFPNGVAAGDTTQTSSVLWARVTALGAVTFEWSTRADFATVAGSAQVEATDADIPVKAVATGLQPGQTYYYRVSAGGESLAGTFDTPAAVGTFDGLTFGVSGDWRGSLAPYPAVKNAGEADLDFFVALGDTIYADIPSQAFLGPQAETLDEFRLKHQEVYSEDGGLNALADLRASTSLFVTIDDHEVTNDFAGGAHPSTDDRFADGSGADYINETTLFENGLQVLEEYNPMDERTWSGTGDDRVDGAPDLYRAQTFGGDAAAIVLDNRSFRDDFLEEPDQASDQDAERFLRQSLEEERTMLGGPQLARLKSDLLEAEQDGITWKFVMIPEPIQNLGLWAAADRYEGYARERTEILQFIDEQDISNVVFITADIHGTLVNNLTYQKSFGGPQIALDAFEISTGAVAFEPTLGPSYVAEQTAAGVLTPQEQAAYAAAQDTPGSEDDDAVVRDLYNRQLDRFGYDRLGLDDNLAQAEGLVDATLVTPGGYVRTHTFGWTEFEVDARTQRLTVKTYGVENYDEAQATLAPGVVAQRDPVLISEFKVWADLTRTGTARSETLDGFGGDDTLTAGAGSDLSRGLGGDDVLRGGGGDDLLAGGADDDSLSGGGGDDRLRGQEGADSFLFARGADRDVIRGFEAGEGPGDRILIDDAIFAGFRDVLDATRDEGRFLAIDLGRDDRIIVFGADKNELARDDFAFF